MINASLSASAAEPGLRRVWSWWVWLGVGAVMATVISFYLWTAQSPASPYSLAQAGRGYYDMLADGFIAGHLSLTAEPDPALLKLKDPYDPAQVAPKLHDASYYKGKYYLYFGAAPALVWFVPWKLITGFPCPENLAVAIFCCAGFVVWSLLLLQVMRRHFPLLGGGLALAMVLLAGLANLAAVMLRRAAFWEVPIAGAYFFNALCLWFAYLALTATRRSWVYLALSSLSLGLTIGSRPGFVFLAAGMGLLPLWLSRPREAADRWWTWKTARLFLAAGLPVTVCVLGVLTYNDLRFENPFEFGTSYQLAGHNMHTWKMLDSSNIPINFYYYFLSPAQFSVYFPFFEVIGSAPFQGPKDYYGVENVYGVLPNLPVLLLGFAAVGACWARRVRERAALAAFASCLGFAFLSALPVLLRYAASASRYMVDFVPFLVALAVIGILLLESTLAEHPRWQKWLFRALWVTLAAYAVLFNVFVSMQHNDLLRMSNPATFDRLARFFNRASPLLEKLSDDAHGPLEVKLRLPKDRMGKLEPLVVTGLSFRADYVFLYYTDPTHFQVGFEHTGYGGGISQPIAINYDNVQVVRIEMGSLYPPETHPYFKGQQSSKIAELKHRLRISVNGVPYLDFNATFYESSPKDVVVGRDPIQGAYGRKFSGAIVAKERPPDAQRDERPSSYGAVRLAVRFPAARGNQNEPLVVTGRTGRGDILYVSYIDSHTVRFTLDHWGVGETKSKPVEVNFEQIHVLEIDLGSLHPPPAASIPREGFPAPYMLRMDGNVIMEGTTLFHPSLAEEINLAVNPIGGSSAAAVFTGQVLAKEPLTKPAN